MSGRRDPELPLHCPWVVTFLPQSSAMLQAIASPYRLIT